MREKILIVDDEKKIVKMVRTALEKEGYLTVEANDGEAVLELRDSITVAKVITPLDFERMLLHPDGCPYGLQNDLTSTAMFRPSMRSRVVKGLYLAGASTHFGGGVPTTIGSGIALGGVIESDFA